MLLDSTQHCTQTGLRGIPAGETTTCLITRNPPQVSVIQRSRWFTLSPPPQRCPRVWWAGYFDTYLGLLGNSPKTDLMCLDRPTLHIRGVGLAHITATWKHEHTLVFPPITAQDFGGAHLRSAQNCSVLHLAFHWHSAGVFRAFRCWNVDLSTYPENGDVASWNIRWFRRLPVKILSITFCFIEWLSSSSQCEVIRDKTTRWSWMTTAVFISFSTLL